MVPSADILQSIIELLAPEETLFFGVSRQPVPWKNKKSFIKKADPTF
jgi:hypothetical protein